jgi:undecaprenyl diphosphate synthase
MIDSFNLWPIGFFYAYQGYLKGLMIKNFIDKAYKYLYIKSLKPPNHIGIIMDGNGRWAIKRGLPRSVGHINGTINLINILLECVNQDIKYITLYCLANSNLGRPKTEIHLLYRLIFCFIENHEKHFKNNGINIKIIGDLKTLPEFLRKSIKIIMEKTKNNNKLYLILAIHYDSRTEICDAVNEYMKNNTTPIQNWDTFSKYLYTKDIPDPDLIIRTSGEMRLSNFLMPQIANSELIFVPTLWPDFTREDLKYCINEYIKRERRFGLTSDQIRQLNN